MSAPRPRPSPLQALNLLLLAALAVLLLMPLLGFGLPSLALVASLLAARLVIQVLRARNEPQLRRPGAWILDGALILLLLSQRA
ncbi:hypothetical protein [Deinococcus yavapaiensis]|uniref:Uncharacterized protein n=1 Tax=Deinococcus yavapaiensis KR-236 TaxID=694435 RepID=A0A318SBM5_9DEIO|nr:hypothetical protein [Deinococcus yavapaiensis]PYE56448.1 hypothetical protein DES52_101252 [Deinococcus yavapaiensis KR-236]